jgi:2-polyprenyl-6-methoxyphenol hydroxylase-like FAD-dependent oxidoreductase
LTNPKASPASKAFGIHARSLEVFHQIGVAEKFLDKGKTDNTVKVIRNGSETATFNLGNILPGETLYPHFLILPQNQTEELLAQKLEDEEVKIHWEHQLVGFKEELTSAGWPYLL